MIRWRRGCRFREARSRRTFDELEGEGLRGLHVIARLEELRLTAGALASTRRLDPHGGGVQQLSLLVLRTARRRAEQPGDKRSSAEMGDSRGRSPLALPPAPQ